MTDEQIVEAAKSAEKKTEFGELVHSKVSRGVNSAYGIGFLEGAEWAREQMMKDFPKWLRIKTGERLPCPAYVWTIAYDNYPDCFEGRLMPNIQGVKVGRDTWYLPVDVIHNLPKED